MSVPAARESPQRRTRIPRDGRHRLDEYVALRDADRWLLADSLAAFRGERPFKANMSHMRHK